MRRLIRLVVTGVSLSIIAIAAKVDDASAIWECYTCVTFCEGLGPMACQYECAGAPFRKCYEDTIEYCNPGEDIVECGGEDPE